MGVKVVLAPRDGAEAVALGVSACFLAVAAFVAAGDVSSASTSTDSLVAAPASVTLDRPRTISRPPSVNQVYGARVVETAPPLVMLPLAQQAGAKLAAVGTRRGDGVVLVSVTRGQGVLALGGERLAGAAGTTGAPALIPTSPVAGPTPPASTPTTPAATPTQPATKPTTPPTTPTPTPTPPPTTPADPPTTGEPGSSGGSGSGSGSGTDSGTDAGSTLDSGRTSGTADSGTADSGTADSGTTSAPQD